MVIKYYFFDNQDDSALNRKIVVKLLESEKTGSLAASSILEAADGTDAVDLLRRETAAGRFISFILMDNTMVSKHFNLN